MMMMIGYDYKGGTVLEEEERRRYWGVAKRIKACCVCVCVCMCVCVCGCADSIIKPTKYRLKRGKEYNEGINLFRVHCMHLCNCHNETPLYY
jgi:hypothetical protein